MPMPEDVFTVTPCDPRSPEAVELIAALSRELAERYDFSDDGDGHFTPEDVLVPRAGFVVGWLAGRAVACGAFRPLEGDICEIKRVFVVRDCRGRGFSKVLLAVLERLAVEAEYTAAWLETGDRQPEAIALYERSGYQRIPNFGIYVDMPGSVCFAKPLA
jgi:GNAT superfamily N-acetyltransferase